MTKQEIKKTLEGTLSNIERDGGEKENNSIGITLTILTELSRERVIFPYRSFSALALVPLELGLLNQRIKYMHTASDDGSYDIRSLEVLSGPLKGHTYKGYY